MLHKPAIYGHQGTVASIYSHSKKMHHDGLCSLSRSICHTSSKMKADTAKFLQPLWSKSLQIICTVSNLYGTEILDGSGPVGSAE